MKFRKKPIVIEAERFDKNNPSLKVNFKNVEVFGVKCQEFYIRTFNGEIQIFDGDWIITDAEGEMHSCKNSIFEKTYEKIE